jgi:hypothetical protein
MRRRGATFGWRLGAPAVGSGDRPVAQGVGSAGAARSARGEGGGARGDGVRAFRNETKEGRKRSVGGFEAQVYSSVNLGCATWALPRIFVGYR